MGKIIRLLGAMFLYSCVATVIAAAIIVVTFVQRFQLDREKLGRMLAVAYGQETALPPAAAAPAPPSNEQPSYDQLLAVRAVKLRNLELREQSLREALAQLRGEQQKLADERKRIKAVREGFDTELATIRGGATSGGMDEVRRTLETIKPKQAKEQIVRMLADEQLDQVVALLSGMSDTKRAKIISEFKTAEESQQLAEVLARIREGLPLAEAADKTRNTLAQPKPLTP
jgi:flagellar motility protein MotE (MotC chaperone)